MNKKILIIICTVLLLFSSIGFVNAFASISDISDFDPLVDINLTLDILCIRGLEEEIDDEDPVLKMNIEINEQSFQSQIWDHQKYINDPQFSITTDVPDDEEIVTIHMELIDTSTGEDIICDIGNQNKDVTITYNIKTGHWNGDDSLYDISGYGRLCGCDDGSIYTNEMDYEIWFSITQTDYDLDQIPYWTEVNKYGTDPEISNLGEDYDDDGIPIEWEDNWGYDPLIADNHPILDDDNDSISNYEEFLTASYRSDPFRKDIFLEIDWMEEGPNGEISEYPLRARELLKNPFHRRNYVFHVDLGEENGGELIPFKEKTESEEVRQIYEEYFTHNGEFAWRRGIFHYAMFVNFCIPRGYGFSGDTSNSGYGPGTNSFIVCSNLMEDKNSSWKFTDKPLEYFYGSVTMHEMGHNFGIRGGNPGGCDNFFAKYPWQIQFWIYRTYVSLMNYQYTYYHFDYSDGTNGWNDFDDWSAIDLSYFEYPN